MARGGGPPGFVHDDRFGAAEGRDQPVEVLVMMKRIAAAPIDQPDIGIGEIASVILERRAGIEQHVRYARHRNEFRYRILAKRQSRARRDAALASETFHAAE